MRCGRELVDRRIGKELGGRYRIDEKLGQGAYARVYRATDLWEHAVVAVKFLHARYAMSADQRARFVREAKALVTLAHPGIVQALDFGEDGRSLYLVMELVLGTPLSDVILVDGQLLPIARAIAIVDGVLEVLEVTHRAGVVHRDLKPANIVLVDAGTAQERIKVLDFGLAVFADESARGARITAPNVALGTPSYMSPEQAAGKVVGTASDIYSVGVILYQMLAGAPPFGGETPASIIAQQISLAPPPIAERGMGRQVWPTLEAVVRQALAKAPADRPTAEACRSALKAALADEV